MICPPYLIPGDPVGLIAPSGRISPEKVRKTGQTLINLGYKVTTGKNVFNQYYKYAGTDKERLFDLQQMLDNPDIKAILCVRGGYGLLRIIDKLDFSKFLKAPKWIIGFSDISVLHAHLNNHLDVCTIHGPMSRDFFEEKTQSLSYLADALSGNLKSYSKAAHPKNRKGSAEGILTGGNLAILQSLSGSVSDFNPQGKILFIEDTGEDLYRIDRMMWWLKRAGKLQGLKGLIAGQFTDIKESNKEFGQDAEEIIASHVNTFKYPVIFGFPAGHGNPNYSIYLNRFCRINIKETASELVFL